MTRDIVVEPLTKAAFAPYGEVIERDGAERRSINQGTTDRLHALATAEVGTGRAIVSPAAAGAIAAAAETSDVDGSRAAIQNYLRKSFGGLN